MSGRIGGLNLGAEIEKTYGAGEEEGRRMNDDNGERRDYGRRFDGNSRFDSYHRSDSDRSYPGERSHGGYGRGYSDRRDSYNRDGYRRNSERRNSDRRPRDNYREPVKTKADVDDNWRSKSSAPVEETRETNTEVVSAPSSSSSSRYADRFRNRDYSDDRREYRNDHRSYRRDYDDRRDYREDRGERREYRDDYRRDERREYRDDYRRDDRREYRDDYRRDDRRSYRDERRDERRSYRDERRKEYEEPRMVEPKTQPIVNENPYGALGDDSEEEDTSNMSLEQLKERAARMNREREEKTAQDLEKRNSVIRETEEKKEEEAKKEVRLNIQWSVSLPYQYSNIVIPILSDSKMKALNTAIQDLMKKINSSIIRLINNSQNSEIPAILYRLFSYVLCKNTPANRYIAMTCAMLNSVNDFIEVTDIDNCIQRCYLDATTFDASITDLEKNMNELVKSLDMYHLIQHLPTYEQSQVSSQVTSEVASAETPKETPKEKENVISEEDKKKFLDILNGNAMGDELADQMKEVKLPQDPAFLYILLEFILPSGSDVLSYIKVKNDIKQFVPLRYGNYGSLVYAFFDNCELDVHVELLNQVVKFWNDKELSSDFLEAAFYTIFDNGLVYEDALNEWKEQSNRSEILDKAIVKLNNTIFQIQDLINNRE